MRRINHLAIKSLRFRKLTIGLGISSIALSVMLLIGIERIRNQVQSSFQRTISGTDLIVGARTGNVSLLLSTVFHLGNTNQNVSFHTFELISNNPKVKWSIPLSLGDSHKGFPVLGTNDDYFEFLKYGQDQSLEAASGHLSVAEMHTVLGASVAKKLDYSVGDSIFITHGMGKHSFVQHDHDPFVVEAILRPTGTPIDQTVHVSINSMGLIHGNFYGHGHEQDHDPLAVSDDLLEEEFHDALSHHDHEHGADGNNPQSITGFMLGLSNKSAALTLQREINEYRQEPLSAIMPVVTLLELWSVVRPLQKALFVISLLVLVVSFAGMLTTIITGLNERRREMAILRSVGARPKDIFKLIIIESFSVTLLGILVGLLGIHILLVIAQPIISAQLGILISVFASTPAEFLMLSAILFGGLLIGLWPAYRSYKSSLVDGLMIRV